MFKSSTRNFFLLFIYLRKKSLEIFLHKHRVRISNFFLFKKIISWKIKACKKKTFHDKLLSLKK
jgi:hypothetical protein